MKRREFLQLTGVSVAGCATTWDRDMKTAPRLREAVHFTWRRLGHDPEVYTPNVRLVTGAALTCEPARRGWRPGENPNYCVEGVSDSASDIRIAHVPGQRWHQTALVDELTHCHLAGLGLDPDYAHAGPLWNELWRREQAALAATGM